ncbi:phytanoyl-CoA dioxygenase family protein [Micromonospora sp. NBC_01796]|uniref:phytanoyl-CoA dioxygenase family protein n=1 Tax=Micromonospora sp. NBC_01796 TaxID=2975987 RepID=UPI002DD88FB7|nr:phytanoyl-CoA dioxygenase family protein [Micromonospora sp. NBC_01796]WSA89480.1 phytanoyl-CoA dioxygenase family protein [Micromonospora sp. NBC_01796]
MFEYQGRTGYEPIGDVDRKEFHENGFLLLRQVLTEEHRAALERAVDRIYDRAAGAGNTGGNGTLHLLGFLERDELFGDLLTHPITFPYIWGLLGWNIYTHHNHLDVTPPEPMAEAERPYWGWHQDGYRQNSDPQTLDVGQPRPMFSLKVAYVLSDLSVTGRGATKVIPGSHIRNSLARPDDLSGHHPDPEGTVEITANPGDAFVFDRRLWHSRSINRSEITRKMLFVGYTYRWIRPLDDLRLDQDGPWWAARTPVQRQLLGESPHTANNWGVNWDGYVDDEIPLRRELKRRRRLDRDIPWLR